MTWNVAGPAVGVAYSGYTPAFLREHGDAIDYVEIPFELLRHDPSVIAVGEHKPIVLHCASLSIAGTVDPDPSTVRDIGAWIDRTRTPWLGEHLSFVTADSQTAGPNSDEYAPGEPFNIGYTVCPSMNERAVERVVRAVERAEQRFPVPMLLENPPVYFKMPGSTFSQVEFVREICASSPARLLLDLAHFYITSQTMGFDPLEALDAYPLERVGEVHISGVETELGAHWDNHAKRAPEIEFEMLELVVDRARVAAITLEYNWSERFPPAVLLEEIARTRDRLAVT